MRIQQQRGFGAIQDNVQPAGHIAALAVLPLLVLPELFQEVAFAVAMHRGLVPVDAKDLGDIAFMKLVACQHRQLAGALEG